MTIIEETIRSVNKIRRKLGMKNISKLPRGVPQDPTYCPLAKATGLEVLDGGYYTNTSEQTKKLGGIFHRYSKAAQRFIDNFDNGKYPHLVLK